MTALTLLALFTGLPVPQRIVARVSLPTHAAVYRLPRDLTILTADDSSARVLTTDEELRKLASLGFGARVLIPDYQAWIDSVLLAYRTYAQVCSIMTSLAQVHPQVCRLDTLGFSEQSRPILAMRVTGNPSAEVARPGVRILGPHHGDEKIATEISLSFLEYLCSSCDTIAAIRGLLDSTVIWVIPIVNVDGFAQNRRENANGVDLNRDYGYRWSGMGASPSPFSQAETRAVRRHALENGLSMEFAFHSAAAYVNYLWDNHPADPPDSGLIIALAEQYADSTRGSHTTQLDPINGYDWYEVDGSCADAAFGLFGSLAYTVETDQPVLQAEIDSICIANRRALLGMVSACRQGASGLVRDSVTGTPLFARVTVDSPLRWDCYTGGRTGFYHHPLEPGAYTLTAHAQGYLPKTFGGVLVSPGGTASANFDLVPDTANRTCLEEMVWLTHGDPNMVMPTASVFALGEPDGRSFSLGVRGDVCLSAGRGGAVRNLPGPDISVYDADTVQDGYWLSVGDDWSGPWTVLGHAYGSASFDLSAAGLDSCRYLRITCDSAGSYLDPAAGLDLDAVTYGVASAPTRQPALSALDSSPELLLWPVPARSWLNLVAPAHCGCLKILDISGRAVESYPLAGGRSRLRIGLAGLVPGVYVARLETATGASNRRFIVTR